MRRVLIAVALVGLLGRCGGAGSPRVVQLPREPALGLACGGEVYPCTRLELGVWLARPARSVSAVVDGHSFGLRTGWGTGEYRRGLFWQGVFADRRAERLAADWPHSLVVRVRVTALDGAVLVAQASPPVSSGYG